jgi:3-phenylpropionate/trans-cinnamate dioxygenase ferredoxin component
MEKVCKTLDIAKTTMKGFTVKEKQILVANIDGTFFAVDALCPHMNGYLPSGKLENGEVVCPVHRARYDVKTGKLVKNVDTLVKMATGHSAKDLKAYIVKIEGGDILIDI